jgi:predicted DNA-binding protein
MPVSVRMPPELKMALGDLASADKRPLSNYVVLVLEEHVRAKQSDAQAGGQTARRSRQPASTRKVRS